MDQLGQSVLDHPPYIPTIPDRDEDDSIEKEKQSRVLKNRIDTVSLLKNKFRIFLEFSFVFVCKNCVYKTGTVLTWSTSRQYQENSKHVFIRSDIRFLIPFYRFIISYFHMMNEFRKVEFIQFGAELCQSLEGAGKKN